MKIVQCATCFQEATILPLLQSIWKTQDTFNTNYMRYQDAARKWKCADYLGAF